MRGRLAMGVALLLSGAAVADDPPTARPFCVLVVDADEQSPLPGSWVTLQPVRSSGAPGAAVTWSPTEEPVVEGVTNAQGEACFAQLPPGDYLPRASQDGFWNTRMEPIVVPSNPPEKLLIRIGLALQWVSDTLRVLGEFKQGPRPTPPAEASPRRLCVVLRDEDRASLPGTLVTLHPVTGPEPDAGVGWVRCAASSTPCSPIEGVADARGEACFDGLPAGSYRAKTELDGYWGVEVGPFRLPSYEFQRLDLPLILEVTWAQRNLVSLCDGSIFMLEQ